MIKLYVNDFCQNCPEFEPGVDKVTFESCYKNPMSLEDKIVTKTDTTITCKHQNKCRSINEYLEDLSICE